MIEAGRQRWSLAGLSAVVTGGMRGIGRAIADALTEAGAEVAVIDLEVDGQPQDPHSRELRIAADISREEEVERAFDAIRAAFGTLDILVNNAGINVIRPAEEFSLSDWNKVISVNLTGQFLCARRAGREMIAAGKGGRIVNIASVLGHVGPSMHTAVAYSAAKAGLIGMTKALAVEWATRGILVNAVCPGMTQTDLTRARMADQDYEQRILARIPMRRICTTEDIAGAVLFLASSAGQMITGQSLNVDGGWLAA
jgi:NAD(P)-dependent dehydrogenase (short-subunit alcohol dehydrogenase family)